MKSTKITNDNRRVPAEKEGAVPEISGGSPLQDRSSTESQGRRGAQGFLSKALSLFRREPAKPILTLEEFLRIYRVEYHRLEERRKAGDTDQAPHYNYSQGNSDQFFDYMEKTYRYRRPLFPQLRDDKNHPILSKLFGYYFYLSCLLTPPWAPFRIIIIRKKAKEKTEAKRAAFFNLPNTGASA